MKRFLMLSGLLLIVGCASSKLQEAKTITPTGTEFQKTLHSEYVALAETEQAAGHYDDANFYANRAFISGSGQRVEPYSVDENGIPTSTVPAFKKARARLNNAFSNGARKKAPYRTAKAQAAYDCWLEEVVDNNGLTKRAEVCRDRFREKITEVELNIQ